MRKIIVLLIVSIIFSINLKTEASQNIPWWEVQSIDTMKYSRDLAREKLNSKSFLETIDTQVKNIANTGATHVAIATPYDDEFHPFLESWVSAARKYDLKVWFRGNLSGWEGWFDYKKINREEHIKKSVEFISKNKDLFKDGDIFSACPECENGGPGDPRHNNDVSGHRKFLIDEYSAVKKEFTKIGKNVTSSYYPMNGDVAKLVMDEQTTKALGGIVVIDHYVDTPSKLNNDIDLIASKSGGKVFLGEMGAPIPDINGRMTEAQQADWIDKALTLLSENYNLVGLNYWVNVGGSTQIWNEDNSERMAVGTIKKHFSPKTSSGVVVNEIGKPLKATFTENNLQYTSDENGKYTLKYIDDNTEFKVTSKSYAQKNIIPISGDNTKIILVKEHENVLFKIQKFFFNLFK